MKNLWEEIKETWALFDAMCIPDEVHEAIWWVEDRIFDFRFWLSDQCYGLGDWISGVNAEEDPDE